MPENDSKPPKPFIPLAMPGSMIELKHIHMTPPYPLKHMTAGGGLLPNQEESAALWQFLLMAHQALDKVPAQTTLIGQQDQQVDLMQLATSARNMYGLKDFEGMFHPTRIELARREAARSGLAWNMRLDVWFRSGGKSYYGLLDRDADKVGQ